MITLDDLKLYLGIQLSDTTEDWRLQMFIDSNSSFIENYCNRIFLLKDNIEVFDGHWERMLFTNNYPINSIESVKFRESNDFTEGFTEIIEEKDYTFKRDGTVFFAFNLKRWVNVGEIKYNSGYSANDLPADIKLCLKRICEVDFLTAKWKGIIEEKVDWTWVKFESNKNEKQVIVKLLSKYRRLYV